VFRLHHLSEANGQEDQPGALKPEQPRSLQSHLSKHQYNLSVRRRRRPNRVSRKKAGSAQPQNLHRQVLRQALRIRDAVKLLELSVGAPPPLPVRVSVAAAENKDNRATVNLVRHLAVQAPARREAEKSVRNLAPISLQPRRLPVRARAKRAADQSEGNAPTVNLLASQKAERRLRQSKGRGNPQRKKERGLLRQDRNHIANFRGGSGQKSGAASSHKHDSFSGSCVSGDWYWRLQATRRAFTAILRSAPRLVPRL